MPLILSAVVVTVGKVRTMSSPLLPGTADGPVRVTLTEPASPTYAALAAEQVPFAAVEMVWLWYANPAGKLSVTTKPLMVPSGRVTQML